MERTRINFIPEEDERMVQNGLQRSLQTLQWTQGFGRTTGGVREAGEKILMTSGHSAEKALRVGRAAFSAASEEMKKYEILDYTPANLMNFRFLLTLVIFVVIGLPVKSHGGHLVDPFLDPAIEAGDLAAVTRILNERPSCISSKPFQEAAAVGPDLDPVGAVIDLFPNATIHRATA